MTKLGIVVQGIVYILDNISQTSYYLLYGLTATYNLSFGPTTLIFDP